MAVTYSNNAFGTLASGYTAGASTITLQTGEGAAFPSSGDFMCAIANPVQFYLNCTSRSGDVLTVDTVGQEGTTATNQSSGTAVAQVITAGNLTDLLAAAGAVGSTTTGIYSALPGSANTGDIYYCTDRLASFVYNGANWDMWYQGLYVPGPFSALPTFTWLNQGSASIVTEGGNMEFLFAPAGSGDSIKGREINVPGSTPWTITCCVQMQLAAVNFCNAGMERS